MGLRGASKVTIAGPSKGWTTRSNGLRSGKQDIQSPSSPPKGTKAGVRSGHEKVTIQSPTKHSNTDGSLNTKS